MKTNILISTIFSLLLVNCEMFDTTAQYSYRAPESLNDGIEVGTLDDVNMEIRAIEDAVNGILGGRYSEVHSMLIYKDGKLVLEEYFQGHAYQWDAPYHHGNLVLWNRTMLHHIMSVTKSFTSTCIELAVDHGFIDNIHQSIFDYLPDHQDLKTGSKANITIEHLLTMTSGLEWREWSAPYSSPDNPCLGIWYQDKDPITFILGMPMLDEPGQSFNYSSGNTVVLGEIIKNSTNMSIDDFSTDYLFEPLGIDTSHWSTRYENGVIEAGGSLELTPRAMLKMGILFLNKGVWSGQRIISEEWIKKSASFFGDNRGINIPGVGSGRNGYSHSWWTNTVSLSGKEYLMFSAGGWGGQEIMVIPGLNAVVVFTGGNYLSKTPPFKILSKYVVPAMH